MFNSPSLEINIFQGCFFGGGGGTCKFMMILSFWWTIPYHNVYPFLFSIMFFELNDIFANINILRFLLFRGDVDRFIFFYIFIVKDTHPVNGKARFIPRPPDPQSSVLSSRPRHILGLPSSMIQLKSLFTVRPLPTTQPVVITSSFEWMLNACST